MSLVEAVIQRYRGTMCSFTDVDLDIFYSSPGAENFVYYITQGGAYIAADYEQDFLIMANTFRQVVELASNAARAQAGDDRYQTGA